jgi:ABC-type dipeptide/oligopeptide/nickel transport system permease subunit
VTVPPTAALEPVAGAFAPSSTRAGRWRDLVRDRTAVAGLGVLIVFVTAAALAPLIAPHDPTTVDVVRKLAPPSGEFPLGTDHLGRDVLSRLLYGARISLAATFFAALAIAATGLVLGVIAGFVGGVVDALISRIIDVLLAFPGLLLALAVTGVLGPSLRNLLLAVIVVSWAGYARVVRAAALAERGRPYIEAARASGASRRRVVLRHILPNVLAPVIVLTALDMAAILLGISALSFLGLGVQPPTPEWGAMLSEARPYLSSAPRLMFFPGAAIFLTALAFNLVGDGLRDVLDPKTRSHRRRTRRAPGGRRASRPAREPSPSRYPAAQPVAMAERSRSTLT